MVVNLEETNNKICKYCANIRINQYSTYYCMISGKVIKDQNTETCKNWELIDCAF